MNKPLLRYVECYVRGQVRVFTAETNEDACNKKSIIDNSPRFLKGSGLYVERDGRCRRYFRIQNGFRKTAHGSETLAAWPTRLVPVDGSPSVNPKSVRRLHATYSAMSLTTGLAVLRVLPPTSKEVAKRRRAKWDQEQVSQEGEK